MRVLVAGGAGYVGSHLCRYLAERGHQVAVFDDLSTGHADAVRCAVLVRGSLGEPAAIGAALRRCAPDVVFHCAAKSIVAESVAAPYDYYRNNVAGTLNLIAAMRDRGIGRLVLSSSAAIFGDARSPRIAEQQAAAPLNPYGRSKLIVEWMLADAARAYGLRSVALRYFNAAGADPQGRLGEAHEPETHLIPRLLRQANGEPLRVTMFGDDYPTPDGSCIRDYVHVDDLASAHLLAADLLEREPGFHAFNLGNGAGHSVRQVVDAVTRVTGRRLAIPVAPRRAGDAAVLVASSALARRKLGWRPQRDRLETIIEDAWRWHRAPAFGPQPR